MNAMDMSAATSPAVSAGSSAEVFEADWAIYRKMVDSNYLFHREAYAHLRQLVRKRFDRPYRVLDLACGDASAIAGALGGTGVAAYSGVDLSAEALALAGVNLAPLGCSVDLRRLDLADALAGWQSPVDLAWVGLSLHHFAAPGKLELLAGLRRVVGSGGMVAIYENTLRDGEDRAGWMRRWDAQRPTWQAFTEAEWVRITDHVHAHDYPESAGDWIGLASDAGYRHVDEVYRSPTDLFRLFAFFV